MRGSEAMNLRGGNISKLISSAVRATTSVLFDPDPWPPGAQGTLGNVVRNASVLGCGAMEMTLGNWSQGGGAGGAGGVWGAGAEAREGGRAPAPPAGGRKHWAALLTLAVLAARVTAHILVLRAVSLG